MRPKMLWSGASEGMYGEVELPFEALEEIGEPFAALEAPERKRRVLTLRDVTHFLCPLNDLIIPENNRVHYINNTRLLLTYPSRLPEGLYHRWLLDLFSNRKSICIRSVSFAPDREKTQVLVIWNKVFKCRSRSVLDYHGLHPMLRKICSGAQMKRVKEYMACCRSSW